MTQFVQKVRQLIFSWSIRGIYGAVALCILLLAPVVSAQITTGSLSGTTRDATGAAIPTAKVTLLNDATRDVRNTVSDGTGYFTFAAVQRGT